MLPSETSSIDGSPRELAPQVLGALVRRYGLTTAEIASAFLVTEATMGRRISRPDQTIQATTNGWRTGITCTRSAHICSRGLGIGRPRAGSTSVQRT